MKKPLFPLLITVFILFSCSEDDGHTNVVDLGISPSSNADANSSYTNSKTDIYIDYASIPFDTNTGTLRDAIAYIDANNDGITDVFMATGEYLLEGEVNSILAINDGSQNFYSSTTEFNDDMPPATHARKAIVSDFNNDGLNDIFVFDHGYDANPYPGSTPKLIIQQTASSFSWSKLSEVGFFHGGAAADIDNDGDIDIFMGGNDPFFYINDGLANFTKTYDRYDESVSTIFTAELIDVDSDGYIDLLVGSHEQDGYSTSIFWGNSTGNYSSDSRTIIPEYENYGTILDFDSEDLNNDGNRDLVVNRTGGGDDNFYVGRKIQLLRNDGNRNLTDVTAQIDNSGSSTENWFPWIRIQDIDEDGDLDILSDDLADDFYLQNDGNANFTRIY